MAKDLKSKGSEKNGSIRKKIKKDEKVGKEQLFKKMKKKHQKYSDGDATNPSLEVSLSDPKRPKKKKTQRLTQQVDVALDHIEDQGNGIDIAMDDEGDEQQEHGADLDTNITPNEAEIHDVEPNMDNEDDYTPETDASKGPSLCKILKTTFELDAIYTGGRIMAGGLEKNLYCLCNNEISVYNLEQRKVVQKVQQVATI